MGKRNVGGRAKKITMSMQELHDLLDDVRRKAIHEGYEAHERTTRLPNLRHPDCQMCDYLYAEDELRRQNGELRASLENLRRRGGR